MSQPKKRDLIVTRLFNAPLDLVWRAWTEPKHIMRWWGPQYFTAPVAKIDFREGGTSLLCMRAPQDYGGQDFYSTLYYTKIVPMERIEYFENLSDENGTTVDPAALGLPADFPQNVQTIVTFKPVGKKTEMTIAQYGYPDNHVYENAEAGLNQSLDKMAQSFAEG
jgi:uncharacterized protein YndB with AHSA1/START domain